MKWIFGFCRIVKFLGNLEFVLKENYFIKVFFIYYIVIVELKIFLFV